MAANKQEQDKKQVHAHLLETMEDVEHIVDLFQKSDMDSLELECGHVRLAMTKPSYNEPFAPAMPAAHTLPAAASQDSAAPAAASAPAPAASAPAADAAAVAGTPVKAPLVGVFYASPSPTAAPYVAVGQPVKKGQTVCIIEAMKVMNEIVAPCDGTVTAVLAENGAMVAFDDVLMTIEA